jgi:hypothetical protein
LEIGIDFVGWTGSGFCGFRGVPCRDGIEYLVEGIVTAVKFIGPLVNFPGLFEIDAFPGKGIAVMAVVAIAVTYNFLPVIGFDESVQAPVIDGYFETPGGIEEIEQFQ